MEGKACRLCWAICFSSYTLSWMRLSWGGLVVQATVKGFGVLFLTGYAAANKLYVLFETRMRKLIRGA